MSKKSQLLLTLIIAALAISAAAVYLYDRISADENLPAGELISSKSLNSDLDGDKRDEEIKINQYKNQRRRDFYLEVKKSIISNRKQLLTGFEEGVDFCRPYVISLGNGQRLLCLYGDVGVHSQNIQIIQYDGEIKIIPFETEGKILSSVYTDAPKFEILDLNISPEPTICLYNRNYDADPLIDTFKFCYYFNGERFVIKKE